MKNLRYYITSGFLLCGIVCNAQIKLQNDAYKLSISKKGEINVERSNGTAARQYLPVFECAYTSKAPKATLNQIPKNGVEDNLNYRAIAWNKELDFFKVAQFSTFRLSKTEFKNNKVFFFFEPTDLGELRAIVDLPKGSEEPRLYYKFVAKCEGTFSIGYCGAPATKLSDADEVWQPLVWTQKRFPGQSYMTPDNLCSMPLCAVSAKGSTYGVCVSPESFPFQPMPTQKNYKFGVMLRNRDGDAQPMVWAPVLGVPESRMNEADSYSMSIRLFCHDNNMLDTHKDLALNLYGLKNYKRNNVTGSLNTTLDNMIDYGMSEYSWFIESLKGCSYETDVKGAVKNTSSLNPLEIALITGRNDIYDKRFIPILEYVLSRDNLLFSLHPKKGEGGQKPSSSLGRPVISASEAASLYFATGKQTPFLINEIQKEKGMHRLGANERYWREQLALYWATENKAYLDNAVKAADIYLEENIYTIQTAFDYKNQASSSFWTQLSPRFPELYNMYEATGDEKYIDAARYAARRYAQFIWMCPAIPQGIVTVNKGGLAPQQKPWGKPIEVPEEEVPAWRVSEVGLHCECAATSTSHRGVFPTHYAAYMRRIGEVTRDDFLLDISNWAIVGRYSNFPGYHMNTARTTVYEKTDFPLRTHYEMNVNSMHYNHIWPHMSIILDYIVSDIEMRSDGKIRFPYAVVEAFANLGCRMYGFKAGEFYGNNVLLWMPQRLLASTSAQLNYIAARSADNKYLYLAFSNQGDEDVHATITLNQDLVKTSQQCFDVDVAIGGLATVELDVSYLDSTFQDKMLCGGTSWEKDLCKDDRSRAVVLSLAGACKEVFAYAYGSSDMYSKVSIDYRIDEGNWKNLCDESFPFEFSIPLADKAQRFEYRLTYHDFSGNEITGDTHILSKN